MALTTRVNGAARSLIVDHGQATAVDLIPAPRRAQVPAGPEPGAPRLQRLRAFWIGQADLAPLALFRIAYGLLLLVWLWQLRPDLVAFFTDEGMLPRSALYALEPSRLTLLAQVGEGWQVTLVWLAGLVVALLLTAGYRTRVASALAFILVVSFQHRNPLILDAGDLVFRLMPFWLAFTAAGDRFAVDAVIRRLRGDDPSGSGPALPVRLLELQVAWVFLALGLEHLAGATWRDGTAAYYALQLEHTFARAYAEPLALAPLLPRLATWGMLAVELAFLPLAFSPILLGRARLLAVGMAALLHVAILLTLNVGLYPVIILATLVLLLSPDLVYHLVDAGRRLLPRSRVRLYYDGACHYCRRTAAFLGALDIYRTITPIDIRRLDRAEAGLGALELDKQVHALDERGRITHGFAALARAARAVPLLAPAAALLGISGIGHLAERAHRHLAERRMLLVACPGGPCLLHAAPTPPAAPIVRPCAAMRRRRAVGGVLLAALAACTLVTALPQARAADLPPAPVMRLLSFAGLYQVWGLFAPDPPSTDGWLLAPARRADGTEFDLLTGGPVTDAPRHADRWYSRWTQVIERLSSAAHVEYRLEYGRMHCRRHNLQPQPGQAPLATFDLYYVERLLPPPDGGEVTTAIHHIWSHTC
ncbi:MAG: DCC1-like thiol-disulfide oxidoreductase family protein [Chloroflexota bacterium]|nr:DCC1-like thiol-disulfide oxidoreductase family protein [Chloroflexota bacterium]